MRLERRPQRRVEIILRPMRGRKYIKGHNKQLSVYGATVSEVMTVIIKAIHQEERR